MKYHKKIFIATLLTAAASSAHAVENLIDFEDQQVFSFINGVSSLTVGDVSFDAGEGIFAIRESKPTDIHELDFSGNYLSNPPITGIDKPDGFTDLKISFAAPVNEFSFNLGNNQNDWELTSFDTAGIAIDSVMINAIPVSGSNEGNFFGLSSASGISYAQLTNAGPAGLFGAVDSIELDNLKYTKQVTSPIPEPSTYALMLGGLGMVGFMAYRRRKTANV